MKTNVVLSGIIALLSLIACTSDGLDEQPMKIEVSIKGELPNTKFKGFDGNYKAIEIVLTNNTDTTIQFWEMSCSWQDSWRFNCDSIFFYSPGCDHNFPIIRKLKARQKILYHGVLCAFFKQEALCPKHIQLGFVLIKDNELSLEKDNFRDILAEKSKKQNLILWSKPFQIEN